MNSAYLGQFMDPKLEIENNDGYSYSQVICQLLCCATIATAQQCCPAPIKPCMHPTLFRRLLRGDPLPLHAKDPTFISGSVEQQNAVRLADKGAE